MKELLAIRKANKLTKNNKGSVKLNIGCGTDYKEGWINIDNNTDNNIEKIDLNFDLRNQLPFGDQTVDYIFHEHFIEHLTVEESKRVLKDCMRVLKKGGVMRIAMPDLEDIVDGYKNTPVEEDVTIKKHSLDVKTRAEWINMSFRWWDHMWLYDWDELVRRMDEVGGYNKMTRYKLNESEDEELRNLETRPESLLIAEVVK